MGGGGTQTTTEQSSKTYDPWIGDAQQNIAGIGFNLADPFLYSSPYARAGQTADQLKAYDLSRLSAKDVYESPTISTEGRPANFNASHVSQDDINSYMNPYVDNVLGQTINTMRGERDNSAAALGAKYAAQGGLGGSGDAIARGQLNRGYGEQVAKTSADVRAQAYDKAAALASQNMQANNQMQLAQADYSLKTPQVESQLRDSQQKRELQAAQAMLAGGNAQQAFAQGNLDAPWSALQKYAALIPQVYNSNEYKTKESPDNSPGMGQQLLGVGASLLGKYLASDPKLKTDITPLGKDPETGLMMHAYRYKGDPKSYPKVVGPMADEIEEMHPGTTDKIGGKLVVNVGLLSDRLAEQSGKDGESQEEAEDLDVMPNGSLLSLKQDKKADAKERKQDEVGEKAAESGEMAEDLDVMPKHKPLLKLKKADKAKKTDKAA